MISELTHFERVKNTFEFKPVDRIAYEVEPWATTVKKWVEQGHLEESEDAYEHFGCDISGLAWFNAIANLDFGEVVLEEDEGTKLILDGNGAKLRRHKEKDGTPEHVDYEVKDRQGWEEKIKPFLMKLDRRRVDFENYGNKFKLGLERQKFLCLRLLGPFEMIHPMCGHENMLMAMALDFEWAKDMFETYTSMSINHSEDLFSEKGAPHGIYIYEDMGFKLKTFMSPAMYREIVMPSHKRLFDFFHGKGCKVIVHSCGYIEPLIPYMIEAGMDCLQAFEVKAGMDLPTLFKKFGEKLVFFGGIDARSLITNDYDKIEDELKRNIIPVVEGGGAYMLHSDHSEPPEVEYETMKYFIKRGCEIAAGKY